MREGYGSRSCVCVCVEYIIYLQAIYSVSWCCTSIVVLDIYSNHKNVHVQLHARLRNMQHDHARA